MPICAREFLDCGFVKTPKKIRRINPAKNRTVLAAIPKHPPIGSSVLDGARRGRSSRTTSTSTSPSSTSATGTIDQKVACGGTSILFRHPGQRTVLPAASGGVLHFFWQCGQRKRIMGWASRTGRILCPESAVFKPFVSAASGGFRGPLPALGWHCTNGEVIKRQFCRSGRSRCRRRRGRRRLRSLCGLKGRSRDA